MEVNQKASGLSAFLLGLTTFLLIFAIENIPSNGFIFNFIISIIFLAYIFSWFIFVHGPAYWDTYRFIPNDGLLKAFIRGLFWLLGAGISVAILQISKAI